MIYYAKLKIHSTAKSPIYQVAIQTFGIDEENTRVNIQTLVNTWVGIEDYSVERISRQPIQLIKYVVTVLFKYQNHSTKKLRFNINAENEKEATGIAEEIIEGWQHLASYHIINVAKHL